jgi:hypothetical protein
MTTYTIPPDATFDVDTQITQDQHTTNFGTATTMYIGDYGTTINNKALVKPDLSIIPAATSVSAASLFLYQVAEDATNSATFSVYRLLRDWVESQATWDIWKTSNNWGTAGAANDTDRNPTVLASLSLSGTEANGSKEWVFNSDGLSAVQGMISGSYSNYGFIVASTGTVCRHQMASSDHATSSYRPKIVITGSLYGVVTIWSIA